MHLLARQTAPWHQGRPSEGKPFNHEAANIQDAVEALHLGDGLQANMSFHRQHSHWMPLLLAAAVRRDFTRQNPKGGRWRIARTGPFSPHGFSNAVDFFRESEKIDFIRKINKNIQNSGHSIKFGAA
ncbi:hypothetical protein [Mesorhizobium silamurunense]|uniref:hypothetical protein n=1 Tax=Mesorhizobium silamurunense TaxID=499528 RepID=UPI00177CDA63|nr:hypothetical protein [Mesorhizobium silamurunense]